MNYTQEQITDDFTVGHAKQTITSISKKTEEVRKKIDRRKTGERDRALKLYHIQNQLEKAKAEIEKAERMIRDADEKEFKDWLGEYVKQ